MARLMLLFVYFFRFLGGSGVNLFEDFGDFGGRPLFAEMPKGFCLILVSLDLRIFCKVLRLAPPGVVFGVFFVRVLWGIGEFLFCSLVLDSNLPSPSPIPAKYS